MVAEQRNEVLASLLAELGWSPRVLAGRINRLFGTGTVAATAPYHWRDAGRVPRPPLPTLTAWVLAQELGRPVTVAELWQGKASDVALIMAADADMNTPWSRSALLGILDDWVMSGLLDRRQFLATSGVALAAASGYLTEPGRLVSALQGGRAGHLLLDQIEQSVPALQRLDDANGGGTHLTYVGAQFRTVALLLRQGGHAAEIERRLFAALAELGQLAGWMAFDAGQHGLAQRYFFTALRASKESGYRSMAAHVLADLAFQSASREQPADAVQLGEAASEVAARMPATVRASVSTRLAYGYAVAHQLDDFERAYQSALDTLTDRSADEPEWMYFLTPNHLDSQAGYALIHAGTLDVGANDPRTSRALLRRGESLLRTGAYARPIEREPSQRRALFEGAWMAVAAANRGDVEQACSIGRVAVARTEHARSARSMGVLRVLESCLRRRSRNEHVADFLPVLRTALTKQQTWT